MNRSDILLFRKVSLWINELPIGGLGHLERGGLGGVCGGGGVVIMRLRRGFRRELL